MRELIYIELPLIGIIYLYLDTAERKFYYYEVIDCKHGKELYICCGALHLYLTPWRTRYPKRDT